MPTIFILFGFRFMFYANDHEPLHVKNGGIYNRRKPRSDS